MIKEKILNYLVEKDQEYSTFVKITKTHRFVKYLSYLFINYLVKKQHKKSVIKFIINNQEYVWLLTQHLDEYINIQMLMLDFFVRYNLNKKYIAYLTDRIGINKDRTQLYGTQWIELNSKLYLYPIYLIEWSSLRGSELSKFNKFRKEMNLPTIEEEYSIFLKNTGYFSSFDIYNTMNLEFRTDKNIRVIRDVSDYNYFKKIKN